MADISKTQDPDKKVQDVEAPPSEIDAASLGKGDILQLEHTDPALNAKMHLVNNAIDEIGFTTYQWKVPRTPNSKLQKSMPIRKRHPTRPQ